MGTKNNFQHAAYSRADPGERVSYREFAPGAASNSRTWQEAIGQIGRQLRAGGVRAIVMLQGSVLSTDLFGAQRLDEGVLKRGYSRGIPGLDTLLALMREKATGLPAVSAAKKLPFHDDDATKATLDDQLHDAANVPASALDTLRQALTGHDDRPLPCVRYLWSSEHHHVGRAIAAIRFAERLKQLSAEFPLAAGERLLVLAYGHAGQLLALLSNLLMPGPMATRTALLEVLRPHQPGLNLNNVGNLLESGGLLNGAALDVVTFGTPVRYGWETSTIGKLLHIVNHRPLRADGKRWLAKMELPQITLEMPYAVGGDYVQQLAIAGTDAVPSSPSAQEANKVLWELLEPYEGFERWLECARKGVRCPSDGRCLLIDYKDGDTTPEADPSRHLFGHAVYTRQNAWLFNMTHIVESFYS